jgi:hypothetical protein
MRVPGVLVCALAACAYNPNEVEVALAPDVVSSLDGTLQVRATLLHDRDLETMKSVSISIAYTDRNGTPHEIAPATGTTDQRGEFDATLTGLMWDGTGTVSAAADAGPTGTATFAVLDRTPPKVSITAPATIHAGQTVDVMVAASDEIGVSQVFFDASGMGGGGTPGDRATITNGALMVTVPFTFDVPSGTAIGATFTLSALAADLSANLGTAPTVTVTVD